MHTARIKRRQPAQHADGMGCRGQTDGRGQMQTKLRQPKAATFCRTRPAVQEPGTPEIVGD